MDYREVVEAARPRLGKYCKGCYVCNGRACGNTMPGPGAKGTGDTAIRNYAKWQEIRVNMDCLVEGGTVDTALEFFGRRYQYPFFAGPVGSVQLHYGDAYTDMTYNDVMVTACAASGIMAFTGDGVNPDQTIAAAKAIEKSGGIGIPVIKPWNKEVIDEKMALVKEAGASAVAMDVDAAGLPFLKNMTPPAGAKSVEELTEIVRDAGLPFIVKGIMTVEGARKAMKAGAAGIVVSNHGGRVLDGCPSTAEVLPAIVQAVRAESGMKILVDGGIRSGLDVFRALALGADACLICRPFVTAIYGGAEEGIRCYVEKIGNELKDVMEMCGARSLQDIGPHMIWR